MTGILQVKKDGYPLDMGSFQGLDKFPVRADSDTSPDHANMSNRIDLLQKSPTLRFARVVLQRGPILLGDSPRICQNYLKLTGHFRCYENLTFVCAIDM